MTRGGLAIDQKMVDSLVESAIQNPEDFGAGIEVPAEWGIEIGTSFRDLRGYMARGLCLEIQRKLRGPSERIKDSDIAKALKVAQDGGDAIGYLRGQGYSDRLITRIFTK